MFYFLKGELYMFREMRRNRQALSKEECEQILYRGTSGVLAVSGDDGYPYAVPINYFYENDKVYFHSANEGHKIDAIKNNTKVSFCVIDQDNIVPEEYTSYFRSVIVFGKMQIIENENDKKIAIEKLAVKYAPEDSKENRQEVIEKAYHRFCMLQLSIEYMSGKEAIELVQKNKS